MEFLAGIVFGFVGSAHCLGMCGPIVLALPAAGDEIMGRFVAGRIFYHISRVVSYALLGACAGLVGSRILVPVLEQYLSVLLGVLVIAAVAAPRLPLLAQALNPLVRVITKWMSSMLLAPGSLLRFMGLGFLNGFLPCGFVYLALSTAALAPGAPEGAMVMAGFGIGTIPAMLLVSFFPRMFNGPARVRIARVLPVLQLVVGILLIVRGLGLGIPFLSPKGFHVTGQAHPGGLVQ
jgi:sulfite exporter TauE/SafE